MKITIFTEYNASMDYEEAKVSYPDGGMNFETFTNDKFIECESLGKLEKLEYNQTAISAL